MTAYVQCVAGKRRKNPPGPLVIVTRDGSLFDLRKDGFIMQFQKGHVRYFKFYKIVGRGELVEVPPNKHESVWDEAEHQWRVLK